MYRRISCNYLLWYHALQDVALDPVVDAPAEGEEEAAAVWEDDVARSSLEPDQFQSEGPSINEVHMQGVNYLEP